MQTKHEFMEEAKQELGLDFKCLIPALDKEYYEIVETEVKSGNKITKAVYDSLSDGQRYHFNKHYNFRMDKVEMNEEIEQVEVNETTETIEEVSFQTEEVKQNKSFTVWNRTFSTYEEAFSYCLSVDFDPETMIDDNKVVEPVISNQVETVEEIIETKEETAPAIQFNKEVNKPKKVTQTKNKQMFYWFNNKENAFIEAYGNKVKIEGYECFILKNDNNTYSIVEGKTGAFLSTHIKYRKAAIEKAEENIIKFNDKMDQLLQSSIEKFGFSPLYKQSEAV